MPEYRHAVDRKGVGIPAKTLLSGVLIFTVGFLVTCCTISILITDPYWKPSLSPTDEKLEEIYQLRELVNIVFIGPSHIEQGIDCRSFDQKSAELGKESFSYNLSMKGARIVENRYLIDQLKNLKITGLKYVFYEPRLKVVPEVQNLLTSRTRYFSSLSNTLDLAEIRVSSRRSHWRTIGAVGVLSAAYVAHLSNLGVLSDMLSEPQRIDVSTAGAVPYHRGFRLFDVSDMETAKGTETSSSLESPETVNPMEGWRKLSDKEIAVVLDDLERIRSLGAIPILLFPPSRNTPGLTQALVDALRIATPGTLILDYHFDANPDPIYSSERYWSDRDHLNPQGARVFSQSLAKDWIEMAKSVEATR